MAFGVTVDFNANLARFTSAVDKATNDLSKFQSNADRISGKITKIFAGLGAGLSAGVFVSFIRGAIDAADHLNDVSKQTGIAVDTLGGLGFSASMAGGSLESITSAADKLNKAIAGAAAGNDEFKDAFDKIGISVRDASGEIKKVDVIMAELADKFSEYADGPQKVAIAQRLMGKSGAEQIAHLNDGGQAIKENIEYYKRYGGVTKETANKADQFNDTLAKLNLVSGALGRTFAADLLTPLQSIADELLKAKENGTGFAAILKSVSSELSEVVRQLISGTKEAGSFRGAIMTYGTINPFKSLESNIASYKAEIKDLEEARTRYNRAGSDTTAIDQAIAEMRKKLKYVQGQADAVSLEDQGPGRGDPRLFDPRLKEKKPEAPTLPPVGPKEPKDDPAKKILHNQLQLLENQAAQEKDILTSRNKFLELYNNENLISFKDYYAARKFAQEENVANTLALYDKEIAAAEEFRKKAVKQTDKEEATGKINDLLEKKAKLQRDAGEEAITLSIQEQKAFDDLGKKIRGVNADLLDLQGKAGEAAKIRLDDQFEEVLKRLNAEGNTAGVALVGQLKAAQTAMAEFNQSATSASQIQEQLRLAEERLAITRSTGAITELEYLQRISEARADAAAKLDQEVSNQERIGQSSGLKNLQLQAEAARVALEQLASQSDLVAQKFDTLFKDSASNALSDFISGTKSAKDAFKEFADDVQKRMSKIVSDSLVDELFGSLGGKSRGGASPIGSFFGNLYGGGKGKPATEWVSGSDLPSGSSEGSGLIGAVAKWFGGFFAEGGNPPMNKVSIVGEKGPELFIPRMPGTIIPNHKLTSGGSVVHQTVNFYNNGPVDRRTQTQVAATIYKSSRQAAIRNN